MNDRDTWVKYDEFFGAVAVYCTLCGRKITRRTFHASDLNHAEMHRLAVAYHSAHRHSEMHAAALAAFHAEAVPAQSKEQLLLASIFGREPRTERELRRKAAKDAARASLGRK